MPIFAIWHMFQAFLVLTILVLGSYGIYKLAMRKPKPKHEPKTAESALHSAEEAEKKAKVEYAEARKLSKKERERIERDLEESRKIQQKAKGK